MEDPVPAPWHPPGTQGAVIADGCGLLRVQRQLETRHATIRQDRNVDVCDLLVGQEEEPVIACRQTRPRLGSPELQCVEPFTRKNHDVEP